MRLFAIVVLLISLSGCAQNGYKTFYKPVSGYNPDSIAARRAAPPPATPIIERAQSGGNPQSILAAYAKRAYILIGSATFNSGKVESEQSAVNQGKDVGADLVLIFDPKYTGSVTANMPITTPTATTSYSNNTATIYGPGSGTAKVYGQGVTTTYGSTTEYLPVTINRSDYGAAYFVKLKFNLGLIYRDLNESERKTLQSNKGVAVIIVVNDTPAFEADILTGDIITKVDDNVISNQKSFSELLNEQKGKKIKLSIIRNGQRIEKEVHLN